MVYPRTALNTWNHITNTSILAGNTPLNHAENAILKDWNTTIIYVNPGTWYNGYTAIPIYTPRKGPDNPTCQLLPISSKRKVKTGWERQERERRWWKTDRMRELCVRRLCAWEGVYYVTTYICISMCEFFGDGGRQIVGKRCVWETCVWESCLWEGCVWASCA